VSGIAADTRWRTDGKFLRSARERVWLRAVTYGPFPGGWPESFEPDFQRIASAGFNALRTFEMPDGRLLDAAARHGLRVFGGLLWGQSADFFLRPALLSAARVGLVDSLRGIGGHPALAGVFVANEIPADLVRWMGPVRVRRAIEELIALGRATAPELMFAYANYPSTEYLEPENADFTAFNIYLEDERSLQSYVKRLHHIAGDRPLVVSEFGLDSRRNGFARQAEILRRALDITREEECAGLTLYAWSDRWWNAGTEVTDWDFGLLDREGRDKPALAAVSCDAVKLTQMPSYSVIVCTRNGRARIGSCLKAVEKLAGGPHETLVVDDGSDDGTADLVAEQFPWVKLLRLDPCGLSASRNAAAAMATGEILAFTDDDCEPDAEWLQRLGRVFADGRFAAAGGPNLPPRPRNIHEAVICAATGAPSHVMLDDEEAEHLPGCNLAVTKAAFDAIGGFDARFHTAGDDVDFCWRLRGGGYRLGFAPGAFVWHRRRTGIRAFLRQQWGYGRAERLLIAKHPQRFSKRGGARWQGFVYAGGPLRATADSIIYHGPMGMAGYQSVIARMLPTRGIENRFDGWRARLGLRLVEFLAPRLRAWARNRTILLERARRVENPTSHPQEWEMPGHWREELLGRLVQDGWTACGPTEAWDVEKDGTRLLLATERGDRGTKNTLVRLSGEMTKLPVWLRNVSMVDSTRDAG
jgi:GT2 family glycosyltransferase